MKTAVAVGTTNLEPMRTAKLPPTHTFALGISVLALVACGGPEVESPTEEMTPSAVTAVLPLGCTIDVVPRACAVATVRLPQTTGLGMSECWQRASSIAETCRTGNTAYVNATWRGPDPELRNKFVDRTRSVMQQGCLLDLGSCPNVPARSNHFGPDWNAGAHADRAVCHARAVNLAAACYPPQTDWVVSATYFPGDGTKSERRSANLCRGGSCAGRDAGAQPQSDCFGDTVGDDVSVDDAQGDWTGWLGLRTSAGTCQGPTYFAAEFMPWFQSVATRTWIEEEGLGVVAGSTRNATGQYARWSSMVVRGARRMRACVQVSAGTEGPGQGCTRWH